MYSISSYLPVFFNQLQCTYDLCDAICLFYIRGAWLASRLSEGDVVGVDPFLVPCAEWERLRGPLSEAGLELRAVAANLVDAAWGDAQPKKPENPIVPQEERFTGGASLSPLKGDAANRTLSAGSTTSLLQVATSSPSSPTSALQCSPSPRTAWCSRRWTT